MSLLFMVFWLVLNGRLDGDVLITGAVATLFMMVVVCLWGGWNLKKELKCYLFIPMGVAYFACLVVEIFKANINVIKIIFGKGEPDPCIRTIRTNLKSAPARYTLANSITLTPGTVTIQLNGEALTVHCLTDDFAEGLNGWVLEDKLLKMEKGVKGHE